MKNKRLHSCNILDAGTTARRLWHFHADGRSVRLDREISAPAGEMLPPRFVARDWHALWQQKLNVAWLPPEKVYFRVLQLPKVDDAELLSMVEFQLEKVSPLPVPQIVWSLQALPISTENSQTVIVIIVARDAIEEFLGTLEASGYQPDILEVPELNQVLAAGVPADGVYIYPGTGEHHRSALVAWWFGGVLQHLQLLQLPESEAAQLMEAELMNTAWAGEMEGWLNLPVAWHLIADEAAGALWGAALEPWTGAHLTRGEPLNGAAIAELSARRLAEGLGHVNLVPPEFTGRYRQQFVDRLWMRGLAAVLAIYLLGVAVYFAGVQVLQFKQRSLATKVAALSGSYTNALQLKERIRILEDQTNLKYAALDCWKVASETLPPELTLTWLVFGRGQTLDLTGTAPTDQAEKLSDYNEALRNAVIDGQPIFKDVSPPTSSQRPGPGGMVISWTFHCELNRTDSL
ncbi:MAG: hypothetical protein JWM99_1354 [Verrucomicrobiales bacterium]|nr:hypothetical protein [Verrucomicrobiales bacterium]